MQIRDKNIIWMETMPCSLFMTGSVVIITFTGLLTCILLIIGMMTKQWIFLLPWQVYHVTIILPCWGGGLYVAVHYSVLVDGEDTFIAYLALSLMLAGILIICLWVLVVQLSFRMKCRRQVDKPVVDMRTSPSSIHLSLTVILDRDRSMGVVR